MRMPSIAVRISFYIYLLAIVCVSAVTYGLDVEWKKQDKAVLIGLLTLISVLLIISTIRMIVGPKPREDKFAHKAVIRREYV